jgi:hypothetical protein
MKSDFFARRALLILCVLCFLIPFAMRGARMSWERMENNVKDWLPDTVEETKELAWFGQHFVGEQSSVLLTWEGCSENDESSMPVRRMPATRRARIGARSGLAN